MQQNKNVYLYFPVLLFNILVGFLSSNVKLWIKYEQLRR